MEDHERKSLEAAIAEVAALRDTKDSQWTNWVALGNGAGCVAIGSALINAWKLNLWLALLPSLWCFIFGVMLGGLSVALHARAGLLLSIALRRLHRDGEAEPSKWVPILDVGADWLQFVAGGLFCVGIVWPAAIVTLGLV